MIGPKLDGRTYAMLVLIALGTLVSATLIAQEGSQTYSSSESTAAVASATREVASATQQVAASNREIAEAIRELALSVKGAGAAISKTSSGDATVHVATEGAAPTGSDDAILITPGTGDKTDGTFEMK